MSVREPRKETCEKNDVANIQGLNEIQGLEKPETLNFKTLKEKNREEGRGRISRHSRARDTSTREIYLERSFERTAETARLPRI